MKFYSCMHASIMQSIYTGCIVLWSIATQSSPTTITSGRHNLTDTYILDELLQTMDPRIRPNSGGNPVEVECSFYVVSLSSINEVNMDYTIDIYMRQRWNDPRMQHTKTEGTLTLNPRAIDNMWTPDIFFPNEKSASFHDVTLPNKLMRLYPNGTIVYSMRITLTLACPMMLIDFPMDRQQCFIQLESYAYSTEDLILNWKETDPVEVNDELELPQFDLTGVNHMDCLRKYTTGDFPCLKAKFSFRRQYGFYLLQTYIPSVLIVILSWVSFWINIDAVPARISLGVTTVLTMATQLTGSRQSIPKVSYPKAIDVWMSACMIFVFGALLEYAFVNVLARKSTPSTDDPGDDGSPCTRGDMVKDSTETFTSTKYSSLKQRGWRSYALALDTFSRYMFPAIFIVFNIVYWIVYTN